MKPGRFILRGGIGPLAPDAERRLAAAYLSQDTEAALAHLQPDLSADNESSRAYARLVIAHVAMRANHPDRVALVAAAAEARDVAGLVLGDVDYLAAVLALEAGDIEKAEQRLKQALAAEPQLFNARFLHLVVSLRAEQRASAPGCYAATRQVFDSLAALLALSPCPVHAAYIDESLGGMRGIGGDRLAVLMVRYALSQVADAPRSTQRLGGQIEAGLESSSQPADCNALARQEFTSLQSLAGRTAP